MASFMEKSALGKSSNFFDENAQMCEPCSVEGTSVPADCFCPNCSEYMCNKCAKHHMAMKLSRGHTLLTLQDAYTAATKPIKDRCSQNCTSHTDKKIKYFCFEHSSLCCSVCITMGHKQCTDPCYIPTASADITNQTDYKQFDKNLKSLETAYKAGKDDVEKLLKQIEADESQIKTAFNDFRKRLNDILDHFEIDVMAKVNKIKDEESDKLTSLSKELETSLCDVDALMKKTENLLRSGRHCDVFVTVKQEERQLVRLNNELDTLTRDRTCTRYVFRPNTDVLQPAFLGSLDTHTESVGRGINTVPGLNPQHTMPAKTATVKTDAESNDSPSPSTPATRPQEIDWRAMARFMAVGVSVRRGRDWCYGNTDGEGLGTVVGEGRFSGLWHVRWECGGDRRYRMGGQYGDHYDLQIVEQIVEP